MKDRRITHSASTAGTSKLQPAGQTRCLINPLPHGNGPYCSGGGGSLSVLPLIVQQACCQQATSTLCCLGRLCAQISGQVWVAGNIFGDDQRQRRKAPQRNCKVSSSQEQPFHSTAVSSLETAYLQVQHFKSKKLAALLPEFWWGTWCPQGMH